MSNMHEFTASVVDFFGDVSEQEIGLRFLTKNDSHVFEIHTWCGVFTGCSGNLNDAILAAIREYDTFWLLLPDTNVVMIELIMLGYLRYGCGEFE